MLALHLNPEAEPRRDPDSGPPGSLQVRLMQESVRRIIEAEESRMGEKAWPLSGRGGRWGSLGARRSRGPAVRDPPLLRLRPSSGLIIVNAWYGKFVNDKSRKSEKVKVIDVTVPLQCLVKDSKLILTEASKVRGLPAGFRHERPVWSGGGLAPGRGHFVVVESFVSLAPAWPAAQRPIYGHTGAVPVTRPRSKDLLSPYCAR